MTDSNDIGKKLLNQNGLGSGTLDDRQRDELRRLVALEKHRVKRMQWATIIAWGLAAIWFVCACIISRFEPEPSRAVWTDSASAIVLLGLFWIAVVCTISFLIRGIIFLTRSRSATIRQIQATLAGIEEQLKKLSEKQ